MTTYSIDLCIGSTKVGESNEATLDAIVRNLDLGEFKLTGAMVGIEMAGGHALSEVNRIRVVRDFGLVFTGYVVPVTTGASGLRITQDDSGSQFELSGVDAWAVPASRVAYPTPATDPPWVDSHDVRTGPATTVAAQYLQFNLGSSALAARQIPGVTINDALQGISATWSARLQPLPDLIKRICTDGGVTCLITVAFDGSVTFNLVAPVDRSASIVLSDLGELTNIQQNYAPADDTFVIAGGQGNLAARTFATAGVATAAARRETFADWSSLATAAEVQRAANSVVAAGAAAFTVRAELTDAAALKLVWLADYNLGDTIAAEIAGVRYPMVLSAVTIHIGNDRSVIRPVFGTAAPGLLTGMVEDIGNLKAQSQTQIA